MEPRFNFETWRTIYEVFTGKRILDPDGFRERRGNNLAYVDPDKLYTATEFKQRAMSCTVMGV